MNEIIEIEVGDSVGLYGCDGNMVEVTKVDEKTFEGVYVLWGKRTEGIFGRRDVRYVIKNA